MIVMPSNWSKAVVHFWAGRTKIIGVRAAESPRRAATWQEVVEDQRGGRTVCQILHWTDDEIWEFHRQESIPYCSLYDEGFKRLGCVGCPMGGKNRAREFARWPGYERLWKRAFQRFAARWAGVPRERKGNGGETRRWFDVKWPDGWTWQEMWQWWMEEEPELDENEICQSELMWSQPDEPQEDES